MDAWNGEPRALTVFDVKNGGAFYSSEPWDITMYPWTYWDYGEIWYQDVADYAVNRSWFNSITAYNLFGRQTHAYAEEIPYVGNAVVRYAGGTIRVNYKRFTGDPAPSYDIPVSIAIRDCPSYTMGNWYESGGRWYRY
jgi:hypothetical protein